MLGLTSQINVDARVHNVSRRGGDDVLHSPQQIKSVTAA